MSGPAPKLASFLAVMTDGAHVARTFGAADWEHFRRQASAALIEQVNKTGAGVVGFHFAYGQDHSSYTSEEVDEVIFDELVTRARS